MSEGLRLDPDAACDGCGQYGAFHFEAETLCGDCYTNRGACCSAEFSGRPPECEKTSAKTADGGEVDAPSIKQP